MNELYINASSPETAKLMAIQLLLGGENSFKAEEAVYAHNMGDAIADFGRFPLVIEGQLGGLPCTVKIATTDLSTTADILLALGFQETNAFKTHEIRFVKCFRKFP